MGQCILARSVVIGLITVLAAPLSAQVEWQRFDFPHSVGGPLVFDSSRDRFVMFGAPNGTGSPETWELDRTTGWLHHAPATAPAWRGHALAYDAQRGVTVLFTGGGFSPYWFRQTFEWNGTTWLDRSPVSQPPMRQGHAMAYDAQRSRVVMFGGQHPDPNYGFYSDTWEWDGTVWTQQAALGPGPRAGHRLVYDVARANLVLFGGYPAVGNAYGDTWTYAAGAWTLRASGPPARSNHAMAYDAGRSRTVVFGGSPAYGSFLDDTWEWDGNAWTQMATPIRPSPRANAGLAGDPVGGGVVLAGGGDLTTGVVDIWRWDGTAWTLLANPQQPMHRHSHAAAFDDTRGELLVFGGMNANILGDFWRWNGAQWAKGPVGPGPRKLAAMAHDSQRGESVLFGGYQQGWTNDTWTWNGVTWSQRQPGTSPSARSSHAMAYDRQRARVVMFGGWQNSINNYYLGDTWEWNGTSWLLRSTTGPLPRFGHGMAHDAGRGFTVLYGGVVGGLAYGGTVFRDTWEWNGTVWTQRLPANDPGQCTEFGMAFDSLRERTVVFGGTVISDTWEWDGTNWTPRTATPSPPSRSRSSFVFDSWREQALLFGGQSTGPNLADFWRYGSVVTATVTAFGGGCGGSLGVPQIQASTRPWLGSVVPIVVQNGPASAPVAIWGGLSNTNYGPAALPLQLGPFGLPGCALLTSIEAFWLSAASPTGAAALAITVPNQAGLLGVLVHCQASCLDPLANGAGLSMTGAITLRLGGR